MLQVEYLRHQSDSLLRLSQQVEEPEVSAKLQELADELRIMASVTDVTSLAADLDRDRPYTGVRNSYPSVGHDSGSGHGREAGPFSFTLLRSRRRATRVVRLDDGLNVL
jgi:hypothetical protein